jgi:hypothetical protein
MPKSDHRSQMARAWLHFHAARKGRGSGSAAPRVDWPVYPRRAKHNTVAERGIEDGSRLRADPFGLSNWQTTQKTAFEMRNKMGSDVFIAASTMEPGKSAPFPCRFAASAQPSQAVRREIRQKAAPHPALACAESHANRAALGPRTATTGLAGVSPYPEAVERASCTAWMPSRRGGGWANGRHGPGCRGNRRTGPRDERARLTPSMTNQDLSSGPAFFQATSLQLYSMG